MRVVPHRLLLKVGGISAFFSISIRRCRWNFLLIGILLCAILTAAPAAETENNPGTIGSELSAAPDSTLLMVSYVAAGSPAAEAGIQKGDLVLAINGLSTKGMSVTDARHSVDGEVGTSVELTLRRGAAPDYRVSIGRRSPPDTYLSAATLGDARAEASLGYFYARGPKSTRDPAKAVAWYFQSAQRGNSIGEADLAYCYLQGEGVRQSDADAYKWFYSAAQQDSAMAEQNLGFLYRMGRGVPRDNRAAFAWYYRSAERNNPDGEWNLGYMYEHGLGVAKNNSEALKWYLKAEAALPQNESLKKAVALTTLGVFLEHPDSAPQLDLALIMTAFRTQVLYLFLGHATIYGVGALVLFYFSFRRDGSAPSLWSALGWAVLYVESQGVAFFGLCLFGTTVSAGILIGVTALCCALPVIISTLGPNRRRVWAASASSWKTLVLYGVGAFLAVTVIGLIYEKLYLLIMHAAIPPQPTMPLISKAKDGSFWLAFPTVAVLLPMAEEIIFRSYLFDALRRYCSARLTVVLTAMAFSLIHFQLLYAVPLFGFGLVLGWARLKAGSLRLPVALHILNNGLFLLFAV